MSDLSELVIGAFEQNNYQQEQMTRQQQRIEELEGVLQFYANSDNHVPNGWYDETCVGTDRGERARKVLYGDK